MKQRWNFFITSDGDTLAEARMKLWVDKQIPTVNMTVERLGFVHSDGIAKAYAPPPDGYILHIEQIKKDGEYVTCYFAVREKGVIAEFLDFRKTGIPTGTLQWIRNEWRETEI